MMKDFRKYATKHLGINGMVIDDVVSVQNQYMNPYILEERQLNVTQMDVFSRLMMDRVIFLGTQIDDYTAPSISTVLAEASRLDWVSMTRCSLYRLMWLRYVQVWQLRWPPCYSLQEKKVSARRCPTVA